jgi:hypothetical protein
MAEETFSGSFDLRSSPASPDSRGAQDDTTEDISGKLRHYFFGFFYSISGIGVDQWQVLLFG